MFVIGYYNELTVVQIPILGKNIFKDSSFDKLITLQKVTDKYSNSSINDEISYKNIISK